MIARLGLLAAVVVLGVGIVFVGARGLGGVVGGIGSTLGGFVVNVTSTPSPRASVFALTMAPTLKQPTEPYTSQSMVDLEVSVPQSWRATRTTGSTSISRCPARTLRSSRRRPSPTRRGRSSRSS